MLRTVAAMAAWLATTAAGDCQALPGTTRDLQFDEFAKTLDLDTQATEFIYKAGRHQGSSIGFHIAEIGRRKSGTFMPYNSSSDPEAEVVSYRLARFLGISHIYNPVTYYTLGPAAAGRFKAILKKRSESDKDRRINYLRIVAQLEKDPKGIFGIYRQRPRGQKFVVYAFGFGNNFDQSTPMGGFMKASGSMPTDRPMSIAGVKGQRPDYPAKPVEKELEIARQLSNIMVLDQLLGQFDRFWRNLEATGDSTGRLQLLARDNGGANVGDGWDEHALYQRWLSRYDRTVMDQLQALHAFLQHRTQKLGEYDSVEAWKTVIGFRTDASFKTFKRKLQMLVETKVPALEKQHGARVYFPAAAVMVATAPSQAPVEASAPAPASSPMAASVPPAPVVVSAPPATVGSLMTASAPATLTPALITPPPAAPAAVASDGDETPKVDLKIPPQKEVQPKKDVQQPKKVAQKHERAEEAPRKPVPTRKHKADQDDSAPPPSGAWTSKFEAN